MPDFLDPFLSIRMPSYRFNCSDTQKFIDRKSFSIIVCLLYSPFILSHNFSILIWAVNGGLWTMNTTHINWNKSGNLNEENFPFMPLLKHMRTVPGSNQCEINKSTTVVHGGVRATIMLEKKDCHIGKWCQCWQKQYKFEQNTFNNWICLHWISSLLLSEWNVELFGSM